ncbi:MAG: HAMP domain-containing sensor histidine kinase [Bacillales bacterium]|nr:HAMP domain-containing sensor histidine kinase [Bacillales bacterium]
MKRNKKKEETHFSLTLTIKFSLIALLGFLLPIPITITISSILYKYDLLNWLTPQLLLIINMIVSFILGSIISFTLTKKQTKRADSMVKVMSKVSNGDYTSKMEVPKKIDNIYYPISVNFNKMVDELNSTVLLQKDFASNFSHEFKTPIMSIKGYAEILLNVPDLDDSIKKEYLQIIVNESRRLSILASSTLLISKLDSIDKFTHKKPVKVDQQIEECVILLDSLLQEKDIKVLLDLQSGMIESEEDILKEVWINLISNAIKYNKESGSIFIKSHIENDKYIVNVSDTGIGIKESELDHIFDRYYQSDSSRISQGNGLGLSIVKRIVDLSNGSIKVKSNLNVGTTFELSFPLIKQD